MILAITPPPSANRMWRVWRGSVSKSAEYAQWMMLAGREIQAQRVKSVKGPVRIHISVPNNGRRDLDNYAKPIIDLLCLMDVIEGDRWKTVKHISLNWCNNPAVMVEIQPHGGDAPKQRTGLRRRATASKL